MYPESFRYTKDHEWIRVEGERGVVGITHHAQSQLGEIVFVELPEVGRTLKAGEAFGTVESVKAVSELFAPVSGEIVEVNVALSKTPETVNADPHGEGWMIVLRILEPGETDALMDAERYRDHVGAGT